MGERTLTKLLMGERELELGGKYLGSLREANNLLGDAEALRARIEEDGYLLIRGLQDREKVQGARRVVLENLNANGQVDPSAPLDEGIVKEGASGAFLGGSKSITHTPEFLGVVESPEIMGFFETFLGGPVLTFDYKWLRAVGPGAFTGAHYDVVYMGRGTLDLYTCWTPLADIPLELGPICMWVGSHRLDQVKRTYGKMDVDRDHVEGWFSKDPVELVDRYGGQWQTSEFRMGDVLIFGMFLMHGSINNCTNRFRLSSDTRYQRADQPVDERWIGDNPIAHYVWHQGKMVSMDEMRKQWGV